MDDASAAAGRQMEPRGESNFHMRRRISRGRLPSRARVFSPSPHPILCPTYAAEMPVITKYFLQFVSLEEDSSCRFRRPAKASPDRKSKPHLPSAPLVPPCLLPILLSSSFYFFPLPSFLPDDLAPLDRRTRTDNREMELAISPPWTDG